MAEEPIITDDMFTTGEFLSEPAGDSKDATDSPDAKVESIAKDMGWVPKESFKGDEADYVDAEMYIRRGQDIQDSMRSALKDQKRQLSDMSGSIAELKSHNERVYKAEVAKLTQELTGLKANKKLAIQDGDVEKVDQIDEQISAVEKSIAPGEEKKAEVPAEENPEFDDWLKKNQWYSNDTEMAEYADSIASEYTGAPFQRVAKVVDKKVREIFPDKFSKQEPAAAPRVEGATRKRTAGKFGESDLTSSQKDIMRQFIRQGIMTKEQYITDIATMQA